MKNNIIAFLFMLFAVHTVHGQNWDYIMDSGEYYYGVGRGSTMEEAREQALVSLSQSISVQIKSDLTHLLEEMNSNGVIDSEQRIRMYSESSSQATLHDVNFWEYSGPPKCVMRAYVERTVVDAMYSRRIDRARGLVVEAERYLSEQKLDMALRAYYWAYALTRSVKDPGRVKDESGKRTLIDYLPLVIEDIMGDIEVSYGKRDGESVDMHFTYKGKPVKSLNFFYNDGRGECYGSVKDGYGNLRVHPSHSGAYYHLEIDYEAVNVVKNDKDLEQILNVVPKRVIPKSGKTVKGGDGRTLKSSEKKAANIVASNEIAPSASQLVQNDADYEKTVGDIINAISSGNYERVANDRYFTANGLEIYRKLVKYGTAKVIGIPKISYFKGPEGTVAARGLHMSFSFNRGRKTTFVEDVVFTIGQEGKVDNISFGLGVDATNAILCNRASEADATTLEMRETLVGFMENYKTAYCLERLDYIEKIFSDDAVIIRGMVLKTPTRNSDVENRVRISNKGHEIIHYNKDNKQEYLKYLRESFSRKEFINIRFTDADVQTLDKTAGKELYGIQLRQEYTSSNYSDKGYLFLMIDFTDKEEPLIMVRTWQPNEEDMNKLYHGGYFFK
ncbi:MAG: hypothetical protein E7086_03395 [Bacteroidales bacterium]|nr:hypothetical protein [Bacteroidales bacterium]